LARVLSRDPFWVSIRGSATHPLHAQLEAGMAGVFASERGLASEWMTGRLSSDQVIAEMGIHLDRRFRDDFLGAAWTWTAPGCASTPNCSRSCASCGRRPWWSSRPATWTLRPRLPKRPPPPASPAAALGDAGRLGGRLRRQHLLQRRGRAEGGRSPQAFFGPWLDRHGLGFPDAVLTDDRAGNCAAFSACGGTAIRWKMGANDTSEIISALKSWLGTSGPAVSMPVRKSF
jgi:hypothetical protein